MERTGRSGNGWTARFLIALLLVLVGAAAATWGLARSERAAALLGVAPATVGSAAQAAPNSVQPVQVVPVATSPTPALDARIAELQARIERVESKADQARGSVGRTDALLIAVASRRSVDRGTGLGYLEPLLVSRYGRSHPQPVATIVTASRTPVRLSDLIARYQDLRPELLGPPPDESAWEGIKRGFSSLVSVRRSDRPSSQPQARYERALAHLTSGEVDSALAETMRLPGAPLAREWIADARRYVAVHRALDEIESAALIGSPTER